MKFTEFPGPEFGAYTNRKIVLSCQDKPIRIQLPKMYMPFGMSGFNPEYGQKKWNIDFSLKGYDEEGSHMHSFHDFLKNVDNTVIDHIHQRSEEIFKTQLSRDAVANMFNSNLKDKEPPLFRVKVDTDIDGSLKALVFDADENKLSSPVEDKLYSRQMGVAIVELNSVYFMNKMCGLVWKLHQLKVYEPRFQRQEREQEPGQEQRMTGFQFTF
jgi:hypothetical protein